MGDFGNFGNKKQFEGVNLEQDKTQPVKEPAAPDKPALDGLTFQVGDNGDVPPIQTREREDIGTGPTLPGGGVKVVPPDLPGGGGPNGGRPIFVNKVVTQADRKVLAFVSDLHLGRTLDDFDQADQVAFVNMLRWLRGLNKKVQLVLLGDIIEIWESVNPNKFTPAQERAAEYAQKYNRGIRLSNRQVELIHIITEVLTTHQVLVNALGRFITAGHELFYLFGNHDDEISKNPLFKRVISAFIPGIQYRPDSGETDAFLETNNFEVYATHGHSLDSANFTKDVKDSYFGDNRPLGRYIVEEFLVKIENLEVKGQRPFSNIDSFDTPSSYVAYYRCIVDALKLSDQEKSDLDKKIKKIIKDFLDNINGSDVLDNTKSFGRKVAISAKFIKDFVAEIFVDLETDLEDFGKLADSQENATISFDQANGLRKEKGDVRCIVLGHTHQGLITVLGNSVKEGIYINTGTWMDKFEANKTSPCNPIPQPSRHVAVLVRTVVLPESNSILDDRPKVADAVVDAFLYSFDQGKVPKELFKAQYRTEKRVFIG